MMKRIFLFQLIMIFIITGCSNKEPVIVKVDTPPPEETQEPELVEEVTNNEEIDEFIEFGLEDEVIRVNLKQIPILASYLQAVTNRQDVIENMDIQHIINHDGNDIYLLEFSCQSDQCSYLLLDQSGDNTGILVADLATFDYHSLSPEETKLLLKFNRVSSKEYPLSTIIVIDLKEWTVLSLENEAIMNNLFDFNWPIVSANWIDEDTISISVPDTIQPSEQVVDEISNEVDEIIFTVKNR